MRVRASLPRPHSNGWAVAVATCVALAAGVLINEGVSGPWWLPLLFAIPMLAGHLRSRAADVARGLDHLSVLLAVGLGVWSGYAATQTLGYIAGYAFGGAWLVSAVLGVVGCVAAITSSTRRNAAVFILAGTGHLVGFYLAVWLITWAGHNRWQELEESNRQVWGTRR